MPTYVVTVEHDPDCPSPSDCDCTWEVTSFNTRHASFKHPDTLHDDEGLLLPEIASKLKDGLAFWLSYYEHGLCRWTTAGDRYPYTDPWDGVRRAGIAIFNGEPDDIGAKTVEDRRKDCERFLEEYTSWCNGNCYRIEVERVATCEHCGQEIDGVHVYDVCGFIGDDHVAMGIAEAIPDDATEENTEFVGHIEWHDVAKHLIARSG
jgi:hypothetical protein